MVQNITTSIGAIIAMASLLGGLVWLAITTAGTVEPFDADPTVIAMGRPSQRAPQPHP